MKNYIIYTLFCCFGLIASESLKAQSNLKAQQAKLQSNLPMRDKNVFLRMIEMKKKEAREQRENMQRAEAERLKLNNRHVPDARQPEQLKTN